MTWFMSQSLNVGGSDLQAHLVLIPIQPVRFYSLVAGLSRSLASPIPGKMLIVRSHRIETGTSRSHSLAVGFLLVWVVVEVI